MGNFTRLILLLYSQINCPFFPSEAPRYFRTLDCCTVGDDIGLNYSCAVLLSVASQDDKSHESDVVDRMFAIA